MWRSPVPIRGSENSCVVAGTSEYTAAARAISTSTATSRISNQMLPSAPRLTVRPIMRNSSELQTSAMTSHVSRTSLSAACEIRVTP